jgi:hypothetical protein
MSDPKSKQDENQAEESSDLSDENLAQVSGGVGPQTLPTVRKELVSPRTSKVPNLSPSLAGKLTNA